MLPICLFAFYVCAVALRKATARWCSESVESVADASVVTPESYSTFDYPLMLLTELAVGLGPSMAPGTAAPFAPKPHGCLIRSRAAEVGPPLSQPLGWDIKLAKN